MRYEFMGVNQSAGTAQIMTPEQLAKIKAKKALSKPVTGYAAYQMATITKKPISPLLIGAAIIIPIWYFFIRKKSRKGV